MKMFAASLLLIPALWAAPIPKPVPRTAIKHYQSEGLFEGGKAVSANLEGIRYSKHVNEGFERWVIDFSDEQNRIVGKVAPLFQIRYLKGAKVEVADSAPVALNNAKFIFVFQGLKKNYLKTATLKSLTQKSRYVKEIISYPAIENGDTAIEFILKENVLFETHQPRDREGRLVLDLKNAPLGQ